MTPHSVEAGIRGRTIVIVSNDMKKSILGGYIATSLKHGCLDMAGFETYHDFVHFETPECL